MSTLEDQVAEDQAAYEEKVDGIDQDAPKGQSADEGKLFDVPRVQVALEDSDPSVLKVAFSGSVELERGKADEVAFYNRLHEGNGADLQIHVHVSGAKTTHRRDSDGNVDAVVATKSLIVTDVSLG